MQVSVSSVWNSIMVSSMTGLTSIRPCRSCSRWWRLPCSVRLELLLLLDESSLTKSCLITGASPMRLFFKPWSMIHLGQNKSFVNFWRTNLDDVSNKFAPERHSALKKPNSNHVVCKRHHKVTEFEWICVWQSYRKYRQVLVVHKRCKHLWKPSEC